MTMTHKTQLVVFVSLLQMCLHLLLSVPDSHLSDFAPTLLSLAILRSLTKTKRPSVPHPCCYNRQSATDDEGPLVESTRHLSIQISVQESVEIAPFPLSIIYLLRWKNTQHIFPSSDSKLNPKDRVRQLRQSPNST